MKLQLMDVGVSLSGKRVLDRISLEVPQGGFLSVLGASGCGKSTLLKAIAGILPCDSGQILMDGRDMENRPPHKRGAVIVFQDIRLFPHMKVAENIAFPLKIRGVDARGQARAAQELLKQVRMEEYGDRRCNQLSGGQQQRVALARALAAKPDLLLLDEPFSSLDESLRFEMRLLILKLHREHRMTTIMVTHDKEEALSMSDALALMDRGEIICRGTPRQVYENPQDLLAAKFFGNANFIEGRVAGGRFCSPEFSLPCDQQDGNYVLVVRPDDFSVHRGGDFRLVREMYLGGGQELLFCHVETGAFLRCRLPHACLCVGDLASLRPVEAKVQYFTY